MRLELALIVGILFFCCWCAYIIAKMNASVGAGSQSSESAAAAATQNSNWNSNSNSNRFLADYATTVASLANGSAPPTGFAGNFVSGVQNLQTPIELLRTQAAAGARFEPRHAAASSLQALPAGWAQTGGAHSGEHVQQQRPTQAAWHWHAAAADLPPPSPQEEAEQTGDNPDEHLDEDENDSQPVDSGNSETADTDEPDEQQPQENNNELEEESGRRLFSEEKSDANERGRDGVIVSTKRRHLINGKPVLARVQRRQFSAPSDGSDESTATKSSAQLDEDFDKLVNEIDAERREDRQAAPPFIGRRSRPADRRSYQDNLAETERPDVLQEAAANKSATAPSLNSSASEQVALEVSKRRQPNSNSPKKRVRPASASDAAKTRPAPSLHEHRLEESLSAQQWDDDQSTSAAGNKLRARGAGDDDDTDVADIVDSDEEAKKLVSMSRQVLLDDDSDDEYGDEENGDAINTNDDGGGGHVERRKRSPAMAPPNLATTNSLQQNEAATNWSERHLNPTANATLGASLSGQKVELVGESDMRVEVLAQPHVGHAAGQIGLVPFGSNVSAGGEPVGADGPKLRQASESEGQLRKRPNKKGRKKAKGSKRKKKKSSKVADSKYKAAEAIERRRASKQNKGNVYKKKRSSKRKLAAGNKSFAGKLSGKRASRGSKESGAKKGAKVYKDKGYKKRGFKKAYHKVESADHKTYFDEFRDKDSKKKWKNYDDEHKYSQSKKWRGNDSKLLKQHKLNESRGKAFKSGRWKKQEASKNSKKAHAARKANKETSDTSKENFKKKKRKEM